MYYKIQPISGINGIHNPGCIPIIKHVYFTPRFLTGYTRTHTHTHTTTTHKQQIRATNTGNKCCATIIALQL